MTSRTKARPVALLEAASDSEDDLAIATDTITPPGAENKRKPGKTTKPKSSAGKTATKRKAPAKDTRPALKDRTNLQGEEEADNMDEMDVDESTNRTAKRAKTTTKAKSNTTKAGRPTKRTPSPEPLSVIPETQPEPDDIQDVGLSIEGVDQVETVAATAPLQRQNARATPAVHAPLLPRPSARSGSVQPAYPPSRERSASIGVGERRGGDPELRRQYNELKKSHENLKLKLESLQEIGKSQAETNFEKLKRASDQKAKDANDLIASLRKELAEFRKASNSASSETVGLQKQLSVLTTSYEKLTSDRDALKSQLTVSQNEVKALEAKLSTARQQLSTSAKEAKERETASKSNPRHASVEPATSLKEKELQMLRNLYSDLTGLVILGVKRKEGEDEFDCLQTGRNGTLHFHLSIANDPSTPHPKTPSGMSYEEAEFAYEPLLDEGRDRELLELLPDYLTEEICFPRAHAQKFYGKVVESITRNVLVDGGEEEDGDE